MHFSPLMLSIAAPVAVDSVKAVAKLATDFGSSFAHALHGDSASGPQSTGDSFSESFDSFARRIRDWLSDSGISGPYEIGLDQSRIDAEVTLDFSGSEASELANLMQQNPQWKAEMTRLATRLQSLAGGLSSGNVRLTISDDFNEARLI